MTPSFLHPVGLASLLLISEAALAAGSPRLSQNFDFDWRFHLGAVEGASAQNLPDQDWRVVQVPHDYSRESIVAMDGATILDYRGKIIAAGAIVQVEAGSEGGGRLAATKTLAKYGQAIKISNDGEIRGFKQKKDKTGVEEFFTVG